MIFLMPVIQLIILPQVADYEIRNVRVEIVDHDHSPAARMLANKISASPCFELTATPDGFGEALRDMENDRTDLILEIPPGFERTLIREDEVTVYIAVNAINGVRANLGASYLNNILQDYNAEIRARWLQLPRFDEWPRVEVISRLWYNNTLDYKPFMVPGILVVLLTMIGANLTALNIVREKEIGTIEQINVTPIRKFHFILGKLIPFWIMGIVVVTIGLLIARFVYGIIPEGNILLIYLFAGVYLFAVLGLGLLISANSHSQQQAMLMSFFVMMVFILMGGLYTSIESMPHWAQIVTWFNPVSYFVEVMRMVVLKGSTLKDILKHLGIMFTFAVVLNAWAVLSYRKRS